MATRCMFVLLLLCAVATGHAQTVFVGGVVNGASFQPANTAGAAVAPGSIASVFGSNLTTFNFTAPSLPLPLQVGATSVLFNGVPAPIFSITPGQINVQVPSNIATGLASVVVTLPFGQTQAVTVNVQLVAPGIFTTAENGQGPGAILNANANGATPLNTFSGAALPGQAISVFGTGFGPAAPQPADGTAASGQTLTNGVTATVAGLPALVLFSGRAPGFVGLDQINVLIPNAVAQGCFVPLQLAVRGSLSNSVTLAISSTSNCSTATTGTVIPATGSTLAVATLTQNVVLGQIPSTTTVFNGTFATVVGNTVTVAGLPPVGAGCIASTFTSNTPPLPSLTTSNVLNTLPLQPLSVGDLTLTGSSISPTTVPSNPFSIFSQQVTTGPVAGIVALSGSGGVQLGSFGPVVVSVPPPLPATVGLVNVFRQGNPLTVTWVCPVNDPNAQVAIIVRSFSPATTAAGVAQCNAACSTNAFTVPASILVQLPVSGPNSASVQILFIPSSSQTTVNSVGGVAFSFLGSAFLPNLTLTP